MIAQPPPSTKVFRCTICDEPSLRICYYCTKDTCENHLCRKCRRCSDCCTCEVPLDEAMPHAAEIPAQVVSNEAEPVVSESAAIAELVAPDEPTLPDDEPTPPPDETQPPPS